MAGMKMPLPYLSHSSFSLYHEDPEAWYVHYYVSRKEETSEAMQLGKVFQEAWCSSRYNYARELKKMGFTPDKARIIGAALGHRRTIRLPKGKTEKKLIVQGRGLKFPILAQMDGLDADANLIVENKFGVPWTQERVDSGVFRGRDGQEKRDRQITWYVLCYYIKYRKMPKFLLQSFNGKTGVPSHFFAKRTMFDLDLLVSDINRMVERVERGDL